MPRVAPISGSHQWPPSVAPISGPHQWPPSVAPISGPHQWPPSVAPISGPHQWPPSVAPISGPHQWPVTHSCCRVSSPYIQPFVTAVMLLWSRCLLNTGQYLYYASDNHNGKLLACFQTRVHIPVTDKPTDYPAVVINMVGNKVHQKN